MSFTNTTQLNKKDIEALVEQKMHQYHVQNLKKLIRCQNIGLNSVKSM